MSDWLHAASLAQLLVTAALATASFTVLCSAVGFAFEAALAERTRIFAVPVPDGQLGREALGTLRYLALAIPAFAVLLHTVPHAPSTPARFVLTMGVCWLAFEVYYWFLHRLMHTKPFYRFHRWHHESRVTTPLSGFSMSTTEALGWLIGETVPLWGLGLFIPVSVEAWVAYMLLHFSGNIVGHANVEIFPAFLHRRHASWLAHPIVYHSLHHARFKRHYGFAGTFMDRWMHTEWPDWPRLHARVIEAKALPQLNERD